MNQRIATIYLDGNSLSVDALMLLGTGNYKIEITESAMAAVEDSRRVKACLFLMIKHLKKNSLSFAHQFFLGY